MCGNGVIKTFGNVVQMANFTPTAKCLPMEVIIAKISVLVKISILVRDSCVDDCAYILEIVPMNQDHSFEASCSEDADFLHLLKELKLDKLNLNEGKKALHKIIKKNKKAYLLSKTDLGRTEVIKPLILAMPCLYVSSLEECRQNKNKKYSR